MIIQDKENGILVLEWGHGDIFVAAGKCVEDNTPAVSFMLGEKGEIGRYWPEATGKKDIDCGCKLRFVFTKPESIDIIIEELEKAKSYFAAPAATEGGAYGANCI